MASITNEPNGRKTIQFVGPDKKRRSIRLGKCSKRLAEAVRVKIERLVAAQFTGHSLDDETARWVINLDETLYVKLAQVGLVQPKCSTALGEFIEAYIEGRTDVSESRLGKFRNARDRLLEFFGDVQLTAVSAGAADEYARWLLTKLAPSTSQKECQVASQFFRHAYRKGHIERNPFEGVTVGKATNDERRVFVRRDVIPRVLGYCPDWQWRTVVALARYGGLRCSSEVALLKWTDIDWNAERFTVTSPKTKRYGKATRIVPIFPELRPFLDAAYFRDDADKTWVVPMLAGRTDKNLGTRLKKIIGRAGVDVWPKPFQNLRSSLQTELEQLYPTYVVCAWLGNTAKVAHKHYLMVTEDHFKRAVSEENKAVQNPVQQPAARPRNAPQADPDENEQPQWVQEDADECENSRLVRVAEEGLEPPTRGL